MAWPGGMRGAIESAALVVDRSWRVKPKAQVRNCKSQICRSLTPLKSPPSAPAHSARPPQTDHGPGFCDFQKTLAVAERGEKNLLTTDLDLNLN